ncbi:uncharacterized protein [Rutidosis leptorrhynchoides]|uniref:uncharacterized protein n=1 Tax=Rutidosis leptorrhynchoides TaxID=125765 RepID=UPI003A996523
MAAAELLRLITISTSATTNTNRRPSPLHPKSRRHYNEIYFKISRREAAAALLSVLALSQLPPPPAAAFSIGISGPKDWLKEQKRKSSKYLLAPIDASRENLQFVFSLLTNKDSNTSEEVEDILKLLTSASRDCVPKERNSFVAFQANTGVEVCTFKLVVKNASSLLDDKDPVKLKAEGMLDDLIRSFTSLNSLASEADIQLSSSRQMIADALMDTVSYLDKFEQGIKECLEA